MIFPTIYEKDNEKEALKRTQNHPLYSTSAGPLYPHVIHICPSTENAKEPNYFKERSDSRRLLICIVGVSIIFPFTALHPPREQRCHRSWLGRAGIEKKPRRNVQVK